MWAPLLPPRHLRLAALFALSFMLSSALQAQSMVLLGGPVELYVDGSTVVAGESVASNTSTLLLWVGRRRPKKITVETNAPGQVYTLRVEVVGALGRANTQPPVTLVDGMFPQDLVRDIRNRQSGAGFVRYTASVAPGERRGEDVHTVTFTMTDQ